MLVLTYSPRDAGKWKDWAVTEDDRWLTVVKAPTLFGPDEWRLDGGRIVSSREIVRWGNTFEWGT